MLIKTNVIVQGFNGSNTVNKISLRNISSCKRKFKMNIFGKVMRINEMITEGKVFN